MTTLSSELFFNYGAQPNDGTGDPLRDAFIKTQTNFESLFNFLNNNPSFANITVGNAYILNLIGNSSAGNISTSGNIYSNSVITENIFNSNIIYSNIIYSNAVTTSGNLTVGNVLIWGSTGEILSFGVSAFGLATDQYQNSWGGNAALSSISGINGGIRNTAIGYEALQSLTIGENNTVIGVGAGNLITVGNNNTIIGANSGTSIATSSNNIIISDGLGTIRAEYTSSNDTFNILSGNLTVNSTHVPTTSTVNQFTKAQIGVPYVLTIVSNTVTVDLSQANNFTLALQATTSQALANPINGVAGQAGQIVITQNATPSTLTFAGNWISTDGSVPTVSTTANAVNLLTYYVVDSTHVWFALSKHGVA